MTPLELKLLETASPSTSTVDLIERCRGAHTEIKRLMDDNLRLRREKLAMSKALTQKEESGG